MTHISIDKVATAAEKEGILNVPSQGVKILGIQAAFVNKRTGFFFSAPTGSIQVEVEDWLKYVEKGQTASFVVDDEDDFGQALLECLSEGRVKRDNTGIPAYSADDIKYRRVTMQWARAIGDFWLYDDGLVLVQSDTRFQEAYVARYGW